MNPRRLWVLIVALVVACSQPCRAAVPSGVIDSAACGPVKPTDLIDGTIGGYIEGWACDVDDGLRPVILRFREGSTLLGEIYADLHRKDIGVADACGSNFTNYDVRRYKHGFRWTLPEAVRKGAARTVTVSAVDPQTQTETVIGSQVVNCQPSDDGTAGVTTAGLWDPNVANGRTQSEYLSQGCAGSPITYGHCQFLHRGSAAAQRVQKMSGVDATFLDNFSDRALFENCPTFEATCHRSAQFSTAGTLNGNQGYPCATNARTQFSSCNTFAYPAGPAPDNRYWFIEVNAQPPGYPWASFLPTSISCPAGPPNRTQPIGVSANAEQVNFWEETSACTGNKIAKMQIDLTRSNPCVPAPLPENNPYFAWGTQRERGNNGQPIAVFRYPPPPLDGILSRKGLQFTHSFRAGSSSTNDRIRARVGLESYWNGKRRWVWIELARLNPSLPSGTPMDESLSLDWNWPLQESRQYPGAVIAYNPLRENGPFIQSLAFTTTLQTRTVQLNIEEVFKQAIENLMSPHPDAIAYPPPTPTPAGALSYAAPHPSYAADSALDRFQLADWPADGTILYLTAVSFLMEGGPRDGLPHTWFETQISDVRTVDLD